MTHLYPNFSRIIITFMLFMLMGKDSFVLRASLNGDVTEIQENGSQTSLSYTPIDPIPSSSHENSKRPVIWVLSVDGGGVKGIIPSVLLAYIEKELEQHSAKIFKVMGGTSTGSIITTGLNIADEFGYPKFPASLLVEMYKEESSIIFYRSFWDKVLNPLGVTGPFYENTGLKSTLSKYFGDIKLSSLLNPIVIPAWDITYRQPLLFSSRLAIESLDFDYLCRKIVQGSCSAPGYFKPTRLRISDKEKINVMDGVFWAISPARLVYQEALKTYPDADIRVVSLGCGEALERLSNREVTEMGSLGWMNVAPNNLVLGQQEEVDLWMDRELNSDSEARRYYRIQPKLDPAHRGLDDASPKNLAYLEKKGHEIILKDPVFKKLMIDLKSTVPNSIIIE